MNLYSAASFIASASCLTLGIYVYAKDRHRTLNASFALVACLAGIWTAFPFLSSLPRDEHLALFLTRGIYLFAAFVPPAFYDFVLVLLDRRHHTIEKRLLFSLFAVSVAFAFLAFSPQLIAGVLRHQPFFVVKPGPLYVPFVAFFVAASGLTFYRYLTDFARSTGTKRNQLSYILVAFLLAHIAAGMHFVATYAHVEPMPHDFLLILFAGLMTYAIVNHRVMDITVAVKGGVVHGITIGMVMVPFAMLYLLIDAQLGPPLSPSRTAVILALMTSIAVASYTLRTSTTETIARTLFRRRYDMYDTLSAFSRALVTILDLKTLTAEIVDTLAKVMGIETASLYLLDHEKNAYVLASSHHPARTHGLVPTIKTGDALPRYLARTRAIAVRGELEHIRHSRPATPLIEALQTMDTEVCIPLINTNRLIGFCNLGPRADRSMYSGDDLNLLTTLGRNAAIALDNARLHEERKRSQILMHRTDRLRSMETIAAGFAHEIRNPLTSIKTFMQLAPQRQDDPEFNGYFRRVAADDVARIERLIQEVVDYSRYREPNFRPEDLNDIVVSSLYFIELKGYPNGLTIRKEFAENLPRVTLDRQQIKQVLFNLFLNALDAMDTPGSRLTVKTRGMMKLDTEEWVQIEVSDSGAGIPAIDLEHIFDPFYSTKHQSTDRESTGLGLAIVHQIIQDHGGYIEVSSRPGMGTTFFINLPVHQRQLNPQAV